MHGPVGSSKSTIARLLKKGLEAYSRTKEGALYSFRWKGLKDILNMEDTMDCPIHEEPIHLLNPEQRKAFEEVVNKDRPQEKFMLRGIYVLLVVSSISTCSITIKATGKQ